MSRPRLMFLTRAKRLAVCAKSFCKIDDWIDTKTVKINRQSLKKPSRPETAQTTSLDRLRLRTCGLLCACVEPLDLLILRSQGQRLSQASAEQLLTVIGLQDFILAALLLLRRWRWIAGWMAIWGLATALSRVTSMGVDSWHQSVLRLANGGVPLTLFLAWHHLIRLSSITRKP